MPIVVVMAENALVCSVAAAALLLFALPREARADACGDDYEIDAESYTVTFDADPGCLEATIVGSNQPGCDQLDVEITNNCETALTIVDGSGNDRCYADAAGDVTYDCTTVAPGEKVAFYLPATEAGSHDYTFLVDDNGEEIRIDVTIDAIDRAGGCSIATPGRAPASGIGVGAIAALVGVLVRFGGRRRRGTERTMR